MIQKKSKNTMRQDTMKINESEIKCAYIDLFGVKHYATDDGDFEETEIVGMQLNLFK